jgi:hypothetical protein
MSDEQATVSDPMLELAGEAQKKPPLLRKIVDWIFSPWVKDEPTSSFDWQQDSRRAYFDQQPLRARAILYAVAVTMLCLIAWSALAEIDEVTRGQGKVIPSRQVQVIQSQDGGVVTEILVREGVSTRHGHSLAFERIVPSFRPFQSRQHACEHWLKKQNSYPTLRLRRRYRISSLKR